MFFKDLFSCSTSFFLISALMIACFYIAEFASIQANLSGPLSLISVIGNVQPFFVLLLSGFLVRFCPGLAPKELFTVRSTSIKIISFSIVFLGLALLALS